MVFLLIRLAIFIAVVGGVIAGTTYAIRKKRSSKAIKGLRRELEALDTGREVFNQEEFEQERSQLHARCRELGIDPDHP